MTIPDTIHYVIRGRVEERAIGPDIDAIVRELYAMAADPTMLAGTPRIVKTWGRRPR